MIVLMSDWKQIGACSRGERAPMLLWDAGCDAMRAQISSTTSTLAARWADAKRDCWWDRQRSRS